MLNLSEVLPKLLMAVGLWPKRGWVGQWPRKEVERLTVLVWVATVLGRHGD